MHRGGRFLQPGVGEINGQYDITHYFKSGLVYELPFGKGKAYFKKGLPGRFWATGA